MSKILPFRRPKGPPSNFSDEALLAACATGDTSALGELFERFHGAVYRVLYRFASANSSELDDLVQTTFVEVLRAASQFQRRSEVRSFIYGIAANVGRHHCRSEFRRLRAIDGSSRQPPAAAPGPEKSAAQKELMGLLAQAMDKLPYDLRVAFVMCDLEEISGVEAARALQIPEGTLWRRLHDARRTLRRALGEDSP